MRIRIRVCVKKNILKDGLCHVTTPVNKRVFLTEIRLVNLRVPSGFLFRLPDNNLWLASQSLTI